MIEGGHVAFIIPFASAVLIWWLGTVLLLAVTRNLYVSKIIGLMLVSAILMQLGFLGCITFRTIRWGVMVLTGLFCPQFLFGFG